MQLYYYPASTASRAVVLFATANELALDLRFVDVFSGENLGPTYTEINPTGLVPTLVDEEFRLTGTSAILRYLSEASGLRTYPAELKERARVDEAMDWFQLQLGTDFAKGVVYPQAAPDHFNPSSANPASVAWHLARSERWFDVLERRMLGQTLFVCGDAISIADYLGAPMVSLAELIDFDLSRWPRIEAWMDRIKGQTEWDLVNAAFYGWRSVVQEAARAA